MLTRNWKKAAAAAAAAGALLALAGCTNVGVGGGAVGGGGSWGGGVGVGIGFFAQNEQHRQKEAAEPLKAEAASDAQAAPAVQRREATNKAAA